MIRLLVILIAAGLVALSAAWIADHDTALILIVGDYEIRATAAVAIAFLLVCFMALWLVLRVLFTILAGLASAHRVAVEHKPLPARTDEPTPEIVPAQERTPS